MLSPEQAAPLTKMTTDLRPLNDAEEQSRAEEAQKDAAVMSMREEGAECVVPRQSPPAREVTAMEANQPIVRFAVVIIILAAASAWAYLVYNHVIPPEDTGVITRLQNEIATAHDAMLDVATNAAGQMYPTLSPFTAHIVLTTTILETLAILPLVTSLADWSNFSQVEFSEWRESYRNDVTDDNFILKNFPSEVLGINQTNDEGEFLPVWQTVPLSAPLVLNYDAYSTALASVFRDVVETQEITYVVMLQSNLELMRSSDPVMLMLYPLEDSAGVLMGVVKLFNACAKGACRIRVENASYRIKGDSVRRTFKSIKQNVEFPSSVETNFQIQVEPPPPDNVTATRMGIGIFVTFLILMILFHMYDWVAEHRSIQEAEDNKPLAPIIRSLRKPRDLANHIPSDKSDSESYVGLLKGDESDQNFGPALPISSDHDASTTKVLHPRDLSTSMDLSGNTVRAPGKVRLKNMLKDYTESPEGSSTNFTEDMDSPVADFFPHCTVLVGDIVGFSAWCSQHEPTQVFTLLQTMYQDFDTVARNHTMLRIDSTGENYVAVSGIPEPHPDHAVRAAKFAFALRSQMNTVTKKLERTLGPQTRELGLRIGMHSGPVTAGVLNRDLSSRLQLFGDTVQTAIRLGSAGLPNLILASESTAILLIEAGNAGWVFERQSPVSIQAKPDTITYWLDDRAAANDLLSAASKHTRANPVALMNMSISSHEDVSEFSAAEGIESPQSLRRSLPRYRSRIWGGDPEIDATTSNSSRRRKKSTDMKTRLVDWNVEVLQTLLTNIMNRRVLSGAPPTRKVFDGECPLDFEAKSEVALRDKLDNGKTVLDEVAEIIDMPVFTSQGIEAIANDDSMTLDDDVFEQLRSYVTTIASMYRENPFHNYEHACHVQMAMQKLLQRVVEPDDINYEAESANVASDAHRYTFGITSDPLTQFAVVFCALIHDVDHTGVSNGQLIKESAVIARVYKNKSVAEQNSIDLAWELLMRPEYAELRGCIYTTHQEFRRFRQLVVNSVLATDIFDKDLSSLRKNRWNKAFYEEREQESQDDRSNRKATIVIEHLIQASDVAHTMQHWDVYRKWNERLFYEMHTSFESGRTDADPSTGWYKGELSFFDNYVIPLAKKLKDCGVFGVSSDECLNYATENRRMWEAQGEKIVADMLGTDYIASLQEKNNSNPKKSARKKTLFVDDE